MRQFISQKNPDKDGLITLLDKDFHYLKNVLRLKNGDMLDVRLPDGELLKTTVCSVNDKKKSIILQVCDTLENSTISKIPSFQETDFSTEFYLFQFIAKPQKMELIIRQATECGVRYIVPVIGEFSQKGNIISMQGAKTERFQKIVREARQQSGSPVATEILAPVTVSCATAFWNEKISDCKDECAGIVLWERNDKTKTLKDILSNPIESEKKFRQIKKAAISVGCEGGISPDEIKILCDGGFIPVHFPTNILRCETAALYGIAALQSAIFEQS